MAKMQWIVGYNNQRNILDLRSMHSVSDILTYSFTGILNSVAVWMLEVLTDILLIYKNNLIFGSRLSGKVVKV